ncbi:amidohydrolase family protein [Mycobacterium gordonae]|nr:amidohydrolase family protein [Mycobacterium gordonae]
MWNSPIIDFHCHVASTDFFPAEFRRGVIENMIVALKARNVSPSWANAEAMYLSTLRDPWCDSLVQEMDQAGIELSVLLLPDFTYVWPDSTPTIEKQIDHHCQIQERHPGRFKIFVGLDPRWGKKGVDLFERCIKEYCFDGLKLYPPCGYTISDPRLYPFYDVCREYGLPVLTHIGATTPTLEFAAAAPLTVDRAALDYPDVDFVLAHGSVQYRDECIMLCTNRPNVYLDVSGYQAVGGSAGLRMLFTYGIAHKILFGTDYPVFRLQGKQRDFVARLWTDSVFPDGMADRDIELFLAGNARRLLANKKTTTDYSVTRKSEGIAGAL